MVIFSMVIVREQASTYSEQRVLFRKSYADRRVKSGERTDQLLKEPENRLSLLFFPPTLPAVHYA